MAPERGRGLRFLETEALESQSALSSCSEPSHPFCGLYAGHKLQAFSLPPLFKVGADPWTRNRPEVSSPYRSLLVEAPAKRSFAPINTKPSISPPRPSSLHQPHYLTSRSQNPDTCHWSAGVLMAEGLQVGACWASNKGSWCCPGSNAGPIRVEYTT